MTPDNLGYDLTSTITATTRTLLINNDQWGVLSCRCATSRMDMKYTNEIIDRKTGEIISVSSGDWLTLAELAEFLSCGRRKMTVILKELNFLQLENDGRYNRHRLAEWVTTKGWGRRLHCKGSQYPFDVVSPDAVLWLVDRWEQAVQDYHDKTYTAEIDAARESLQRFQSDRGRSDMTVQMMVCWLTDTLPELTQEKIAGVLDVTQQVVSKFLKTRSKQLSELREMKANMFLP